MKEEFLFGMSLHLGTCTNAASEYVSMVLGNLIFALFVQPVATIRSDSTLTI